MLVRGHIKTSFFNYSHIVFRPRCAFFTILQYNVHLSVIFNRYDATSNMGVAAGLTCASQVILDTLFPILL